MTRQKSPFLRRALALVATAALTAVIAYLTLSEPQSSNPGSLLNDKAYHFIAFAALVFPAALLYARSLVWVIPAALMFGAGIELIQPYVGRSREGLDFIADIFGVGVGLFLGQAIRALLRKRARMQGLENP